MDSSTFNLFIFIGHYMDLSRVYCCVHSHCFILFLTHIWFCSCTTFLSAAHIYISRLICICFWLCWLLFESLFMSVWYKQFPFLFCTISLCFASKASSSGDHLLWASICVHGHRHAVNKGRKGSGKPGPNRKIVNEGSHKYRGESTPDFNCRPVPTETHIASKKALNDVIKPRKILLWEIGPWHTLLPTNKQKPHSLFGMKAIVSGIIAL